MERTEKFPGKRNRRPCTNHSSVTEMEPLADYSRIVERRLVPAAYEQVRRNSVVVGACLEHRFAKQARREYGQVRFQGVKYYCHVIAAMVATGRAPAGAEEASHLCGNPKCVKVEHLTFDEDGEYNKTRQCCHKFLGVAPGYTCPHVPQCIVPSE